MRRLWAVLWLVAMAGACSPADTPPVAAAQKPAPAPEAVAPAPVAEEPPVAPDRVGPLREALQAVVAAQQYPAMPAPDPVSDEELAAIREEVAGLRQEVADLRSELNEYLEELLQGLQKENERLRDEILRLSARIGESEGDRPRVPAPGDDFVDEVVAERQLPEPEPMEAPEPARPALPFVFTSVKEWGRSPEEAAKAPGGARSLFGMVGVVPRGSQDSDLLNLAQDLRERYGAYDNINVEVFDSAETAQAYAETRSMDAAHHVLSVSKHADSGRDVILLYRNGVPIDVTPGQKNEGALIPLP